MAKPDLEFLGEVVLILSPKEGWGKAYLCWGLSALVVDIPGPGIFTIVQRKQAHLASSCSVPTIVLVGHEGFMGFREYGCSTQEMPAQALPSCPALVLCLLRLACSGTLLFTPIQCGPM